MRKAAWICLLSTSYCWVPEIVYAQTNASDDATRSTFEEVIVTGRRSTPGAVASGIDALGNRPILDTPFQVSVYDSDLLQNVQARSLDEVARLTPGATIRTNDAQAGGSFFQIRGFDITSVFFDGQPGPSGDTILRTNVPLEVFDSLQILKGAAGFIYGYTAPGGAINYITKQPTSDPFAQATVGFTETGLFRGHVDTSISNQADTAGVRLNAVGETGTLKIAGVKIDRYAAALNAGFALSPTTRLRVNALYSDRTTENTIGGFVPQFVGRIAEFSGKQQFAPEESRSNTSTGQIGAVLIQDIGKDWVARLNLDYTRLYTGSQLFTLLLDNANGDYRARQGVGASLSKTASAQLIVKGNFETGPIGHSITIGGSIQRLDQTATPDQPLTIVGTGNIYAGTQTLNRSLLRTTPSLGSVGYDFKDLSQDSVFISDVIDLTSGFEALLGVRKTYYERSTFNPTGARASFTDESPTLPSYSLIYKPSGSSTLYASYSKGLQPGVSISSFASNFFPGATLRSAKSEQYEAGFKIERGAALLSAAVFRLEFELSYCLDATGLTNRPGCTQAYYGTQRHDGVEASIVGKINRQLSVTGGFQYLDPTQVGGPFDGLEPITVPRFAGKVLFDYEPAAVPGLGVLVGIERIGEHYFDAFNQVKFPSYTVVDLGVRKSLGDKDRALILRLDVSNVFGEKYFYPRNTLEQGAPRVFKASVTKTF